MVWLQVAPVASELLPVAWVFMVFADPRGQRVATRGLGFHGFCRVLSVASGKITGSSGIYRVLSVARGQNPWFSWYLQGLVSGKWPKPMVFMVFAGSCQWQVAKTHGFHGICRVLSVASGHNPWLSWYLQGLVSG